jgi:two-component system nitrate/nitrite response regulator NarL
VTDSSTARSKRLIGADSERIAVLVVAGIRVYRDGLCQLLRAHPSIATAACARGVDEALLVMRSLQPDALIVDVASPSGMLAARRLGEAVPQVPVVGTGLAETERDVIAAVEAGLAGFVSGEAGIEELIEAARSATRGELLCSPRVAAILRRRLTALSHDRGREEAARLTMREREIMALVDAGLSNREVARRLSIELSTVKNHLHNVFDKLDVNDREAALARLHAAGTGPPDPVPQQPEAQTA